MTSRSKGVVTSTLQSRYKEHTLKYTATILKKLGTREKKIQTHQGGESMYCTLVNAAALATRFGA